MTTTTDAVFRISHVFKAPRAKVWAAWTQPDELARWFGPKGCDTTLIEYDLRPGGAWFARMDMQGAPPMYGRFIFREVDAPSRLQWVHGFSDDARNRNRAPFPGAAPGRWRCSPRSLVPIMLAERRSRLLLNRSMRAKTSVTPSSPIWIRCKAAGPVPSSSWTNCWAKPHRIQMVPNALPLMGEGYARLLAKGRRRC